MRRHALLVLPAALLLLSGCGASGGSSASDSPTKASSSSKTSTTTSSGSSSAKLPDACSVVTPAIVEENFGVTVTAGKAKPSFTGGSSCTLSDASGDNTFDVFTSPEPDKYMADATYAGTAPIKLTASGVTRGAANLPSDVYVVKGKVGVLVEITTADQEKDPDDQGLKFGNEIAGNF